MKKKKAPLVRRMKEFVKTSVVWGPLDHNLFFTIIFLNVYGIIMVYSASYNNSITKNYSYFMNNQLKNVIFGFVIMIVASYVNYHRIVRMEEEKKRLLFARPGFFRDAFSFQWTARKERCFHETIVKNHPLGSNGHAGRDFRDSGGVCQDSAGSGGALLGVRYGGRPRFDRNPPVRPCPWYDHSAGGIGYPGVFVFLRRLGRPVDALCSLRRLGGAYRLAVPSKKTDEGCGGWYGAGHLGYDADYDSYELYFYGSCLWYPKRCGGCHYAAGNYPL